MIEAGKCYTDAGGNKLIRVTKVGDGTVDVEILKIDNNFMPTAYQQDYFYIRRQCESEYRESFPNNKFNSILRRFGEKLIKQAEGINPDRV
jgi:hypothetical protein